MDLKHLFLSLKGRIGRASWWLGFVTLFVLSYGVAVLFGLALGVPWITHFDASPLTPQLIMADALTQVALLHPMLSVDIKRLHDRGRTAWWVVAIYLPLFVISGFQGAGFEIEDLLKQWYGLFLIISWLSIVLWLWFEMGFRRGVTGASKYGPDPLEAVAELA